MACKCYKNDPATCPHPRDRMRGTWVSTIITPRAPAKPTPAGYAGRLGEGNTGKDFVEIIVCTWCEDCGATWTGAAVDAYQEH